MLVQHGLYHYCCCRWYWKSMWICQQHNSFFNTLHWWRLSRYDIVYVRISLSLFVQNYAFEISHYIYSFKCSSISQRAHLLAQSVHIRPTSAVWLFPLNVRTVLNHSMLPQSVVPMEISLLSPFWHVNRDTLWTMDNVSLAVCHGLNSLYVSCSLF